MQIAVKCPRCETSYQLDSSLRGKRMRCPNKICGALIEIRGDDEPAAPPPPPPAAPPPPRMATSVPQVKAATPPAAPVLVVPAAAPGPAAPAPVPQATVPPSALAAVPTPAPPMTEADGIPGDFPGDNDDDAVEAAAPVVQSRWQAPPVRSPPPASRSGPAPRLHSAAAPAAQSRGRRALVVLSGMMLLLATAAAVALWRFSADLAQHEAERWDKAMKAYDEPDFVGAQLRLQALHNDFPRSPDAPKYRFLGELADVRAAAHKQHEDDADLRKAAEQMTIFLDRHRSDPLLKERYRDVGATLQHLVERLTALAEQQRDASLLKRARDLAAELERAPAGSITTDARQKLQQQLEGAENTLRTHITRLTFLERLRGYTEQTTAVDVRQARELLGASGLKGDAEAAAIVAEVEKAHRAALRYEPDSGSETRPVAEDVFPSLVVLPARGQASAAALDGVVLALARGVLYALQAGDGALRWARRVGEDLGALPLRVPADELAPELVLVLSSDNRTVTALVADTGAVWWQQTLASREPCLGQPVLIERSLLLPTASGQVEEIEISRGRRLGSYILGQPLSLGAVRQPGTPLVYVPADEYCVYVLDASARRCAAVLYTGHAAGALQTLPLVVPADGSEASAPASASTGWLVLALNQGDHRTELRAYTLPIRQADQAPDPHAPRVEGGVALAPWHGAGQLAVATDGGRLALLGLPQRGSRDPLFFPLLKDDSYAVGSGAAPMRALIAHADVENYWVLSHGKLHRLQRTFRPQTGPDLVQRWPQPPLLGVPLHEASQRTARDGASILYLTTQLPGQPTCLASAVHADSGRIVWQRQLGALPQEPLVAAGDRVLLADAAGLFAFDPATAGAESFKAAGQLLLPRAEPLHEQALLAGARGVWLLRWPARTEVDCPLQIEHVDLAPAAQAKGRRVVLKAAPRGTPALLDDAVLLPLANGIVARVPAADGSPMLGPNWRGDGVDEAQPGHIVAAGSADFFLTDGNRGLKRLHWGTQGDAAVRARAELPHRVVTAPALLWRSQQPWLCVADAAHGLTLLNPRLEVQRRWQLPGTVTAGPFVRDGKIGCVSNQTLFWFDPDAEAPVWEFALAAAPVGAPLLVDGALVVADVQGTLRILDPATGTPRGDGYTFRANVAPVAAPLPLGSGRLFVPLSDGTVMLVPLAALQSGDDPPD